MVFYTYSQNKMDKLTILLNSDPSSAQQLPLGYKPDLKWSLNKTIIYKPTNAVFPLDILLKDAVITTTQSNVNDIVEPILEYLINTIKSICSYKVANEIGFRFTIYTNQNINHTKFKKYDIKYNETFLDERLTTDMNRYELVFKFDELWNLVTTQPTIKQSAPLVFGGGTQAPSAATSSIFDGTQAPSAAPSSIFDTKVSPAPFLFGVPSSTAAPFGKPSFTPAPFGKPSSTASPF